MAGTSPGCKDYSVYVVILKYMSDGWTGFVFELFLVTAAAHEASNFIRILSKDGERN